MIFPTAYLYELRREGEIIATDHQVYERPLEIGDHVTIAGHAGIVHSIIPIRAQNERRLVVQLLPAGDNS
jgi:hypothetical protein